MSFSFNRVEDQTLWDQALRIATLQHEGQLRKGAAGDPYINHVIEVAEMVNAALIADDMCDVNMVVAAVLHDVIEDSEITQSDLVSLFNLDVADLVVELTDPDGVIESVRWQAQIDHTPSLSSRAKVIKIADKISNLQELLRDPPPSWSVDRRIAYLEWGEAVFAGAKGESTLLDEAFKKVSKDLRQALEQI